jgi:hypothetical protein
MTAALVQAMNRPRRDLLALIALLGGLAGLLVGPGFAGGMIFAPDDLVAAALPDAPTPPARVGNGLLSDVAYAVNPWRLLAREEWAAGRLPLWNDRQLLGTPLLANLQSAVFSPWSWLLYLAAPGAGLAALTWLKLVLAGLGMALFTRRLGLHGGAVALAAVSFMLCAHMVCWLQWTIAEVFLLGPWLLWLARGWLDTGGGRWLLGWALGVALAVVGGHIESAWNVVVLAGSYAGMGLLARAWAARRAGTEGWARALLRDGALLAGASLLGVGLAAAQLLPFLAQLPISLQAVDRANIAAAGVQAYLPPEAVLTWLIPNAYGNPIHDLYWGPFNYNELVGYVGLVALILAPLALLRRPRGETAFWVGAALVSAGMAWHLPIIGWLDELPGFSSSLLFRLHSVTQIAVIVLGALGADWLLRRTRPQPRSRWLPLAAGRGVALAALVGLALHLPWYVAPHPTTPDPYRAVWIGWALIVAGVVGMLIAAWWGGLPRRALAGGLLALAVVDLLRFAWGYNYATPAAQFYPPTPFTQALVAQPGRGAVLGAEVQANLAAAYGWRDYRAYDPMLDIRHKTWTRLMSRGTYNGPLAGQYNVPMDLLPPRPDMFSAIGLAWIAARDPQDPNALPPEPVPVPAPPDGPAFVRTATVAGFGLWQNRYARPFAYFAGTVQPLPGGDAIWQVYRNQPGTAWDRTFVEGQDTAITALPAAQAPEPRPGDAPAQLALGAGTVTPTGNAPGDLRFTVARPAGQAGLLVVNESWAAGWQASVDDQPVPLYRVNYLVQGLIVPGGSHTVRLVYAPPEVTWGLGLSLASVVLWLILTWFVVRGSWRVSRGSGIRDQEVNT